MAELRCSALLANASPRQGVTRSWVGVDTEANGLWRARYSGLQEEENAEDGCGRTMEGDLSRQTRCQQAGSGSALLRALFQIATVHSGCCRPWTLADTVLGPPGFWKATVSLPAMRSSLPSLASGGPCCAQHLLVCVLRYLARPPRPGAPNCDSVTDCGVVEESTSTGVGRLSQTLPLHGHHVLLIPVLPGATDVS